MTNSRPLRFAVSTVLAVGVIACDSDDKNAKDDEQDKQDNEPEREDTVNEGPKVEEPKVEEPKVEQPKVEEPKVEDPDPEDPSHINANEGPKKEPKPIPKRTNMGPQPVPSDTK